ncbi:DinQ-like type I toxin DqlB [Serratia marcescens]|nr:DinQ-like type I toxin DqlB [Serratia marcescens]MDX7573837.1 DinQ-like type I toxin DqlB [Serratia marcescens]
MLVILAIAGELFDDCPTLFHALLVAVSNAVIAVLELIRQYFD